MFWYLLLATTSFSLGFVLASLLISGKRQDRRRAADVLLQAASDFTSECENRKLDAAGNLVIAQDEIATLKRALKLSDDLQSS